MDLISIYIYNQCNTSEYCIILYVDIVSSSQSNAHETQTVYQWSPNIAGIHATWQLLSPSAVKAAI